MRVYPGKARAVQRFVGAVLLLLPTGAMMRGTAVGAKDNIVIFCKNMMANGTFRIFPSHKQDPSFVLGIF